MKKMFMMMAIVSYATVGYASSYKTMYEECNKRFNEKACTDLGLYHIRKRGENKTGVRYLQKACKLDSARACLIVGNIFKDGKYACRDPFLAKAYFDKSCKLGSESACNRYNNYRPYVVYVRKSIIDIIKDTDGKNLKDGCACKNTLPKTTPCPSKDLPKYD